MHGRKSVEKLFNKLDNLKLLKTEFPNEFREGESIICMDKETALSILDYARTDADTKFNANDLQETTFEKYIEERYFLVQGVKARVICDSGIGWFLGVM